MTFMRCCCAVALFSLSPVIAAQAETFSDPPVAVAEHGYSAHEGHRGMGHHPHVQGMALLLHALDLSDEQRGRVHELVKAAQARKRSERAEARADRDALLVTPPTDPGYPALVTRAKADAAARIDERAALWTDVYAVLTPAQRARIPALVAQFSSMREDLHGWNPHKKHVEGPL